MKTRRTLLALVLSVMMVIGLFPVTAMAEGGVKYLDWDATNKKLVETEYTGTYTSITDTVTDWTDTAENPGWYVVNSNVTIDSRVTVTGNVHLILADGCTLTVNGGINVSEGHSLTIYAQSIGNNAGKLDAIVNVTGNNDNAAIGGNEGQNCGTITINGGTVTATASSQDGENNGAAIGGGGSYSGPGGSGGTITINGGTVTATATASFEICDNNGAAIGGGNNGSGGTITINGGTVTATASSQDGDNYGAAIGGGDYGSGGTITINGGIVNAEASSSSVSSANEAAAIGGGYGSSCGIITISDGIVTATASGVNNNYAAAIGNSLGGEGGTITISGGAVTATATVTNGTDRPTNRGAAIGGKNVTITINGGMVNATAQAENGTNNGAAIGGEDHGSVGTITIKGGTVNSTTLGNSNYGAAIGGGAGKSGGKITISGGTVTAAVTAKAWSVTGAAIGGGYGYSGSGGDITISGGTVTATVTAKAGSGTGAAIGNGGDYSGSAGSFSTNEDEKNGSAVIFASTTSDKPAISDQSQKGNWSGIIFEGTNSGTVYGNPIITEDAEIPAGYTLEVSSGKTVTIAEGATLTIADGATLANNGTVDIKGTVDGNISGTGKLSCPVSITATNLEHNGQTTANNQANYEVTFEPKDGYKLPESVTVKVGGTTLTQGNYTFANGTLTIPKEKITGNIEITASGILQSYLLTVENGGDGATVSGNYDYGATVTLSAGEKAGHTFAGWTLTGATVSDLSSQSISFTMPANTVTAKANWTEIPVEPEQPETPSEPEYIPIPAPDYPAPVYRNTWHKSGKNWYFYDEDGQKVKGWYKDGNTWYYLSEKTGAMVYGGMLEIDGETYYFYDWGGMASGWWYLDETTGEWYFFRGNGAMAKSAWVEWKGEWYYLGADGKMLKGTTTPDGYRVDANGKWIR